jgi:hypothetical protein
MAYSGIPMTYTHGDSTYNFNSAGMFELYAMKNNDTLRIRQGSAVRVDFMMTQTIPGTEFYSLNRKENHWKQIGKIESEPRLNAKFEMKVKLKGQPVSTDIQEEGFARDTAAAGPNVFFAQPLVADGPAGKGNGKEWSQKNNNAGKLNGSLLAEGADKGHSYPGIVKGLACKEFGVYNCDQTYRMGRSISVKPVFKDKGGNIIARQNVMTLIDLNYNGSFSFDPGDYFSLNPRSKNVMLLFTKDNKVYAFNEEDFKQAPVAKSGTAVFVMNDVSLEVKNTADLRKYLGLNP